MASIEQLEAVTEAWDRVGQQAASSQAALRRKAEAVLLFRKMADSFKGVLDAIEPKYWKTDGEGMMRLAADFDELTSKIRQAIRISGEQFDGPAATEGSYQT
jgi:hypothetical protein